MRFQLWTINRILRAIGFVISIEVDCEGDDPTIIAIERAKTYDERAKGGSE